MNVRRSRASRALIASILLAGLSSGCAHLGFGPSVNALIDQGIELYHAGDYDASIAKFEEAIQRDPQRWVAYLYLARSYVVKRDWPSAILNGRRALEIQPGDVEIVKVLADALLGAGLDALRSSQWKSAAGHLIDYIALRPADAQGYLALARAHAGGGDFASAARALIDGLASSKPTGGRSDLVAELRSMAGRAIAGGDPAAAAQLLGNYVQREPHDLQAWLDLGKAFWASGDKSQALHAFREALTIQPGHPEALGFLTR